MLAEPVIDRRRLQTILHDAYGLNVVDLAFIPKGEESWNYVVHCDDGSRCLLKIYATASPSGELFEFVYRLRYRSHIREVVSPHRTVTGKMLVTLYGRPAALFPYIDGPSLADRHPSDDRLYQLGRSLARIHGCTGLRSACPTVERFDVQGQDQFHRILAALEDGKDTFRGYQATVKDLLLPAKATIEHQFAALHAVQQRVRNLDLAFVICHGEPSPGNVLFDKGGRVYLVDWYTAILAPRERDLIFFLESECQAVLDGYRSIVPDPGLDETVVEFCRRQWTMGEITFWSSRILFSDTGDEERKRDMDELLEVLGWIGIP